jgi:hypothetical protein
VRPIQHLVWIVLLAIFWFPRAVSAHDDPVVTVRIMSNGFNVLDIDAVLGEISDSATLNVDGQVHGADQIERWVKQQMDSDLRIEIVDIGTPQVLPDGYTLAWKARFSRQDWRKAGIPARQVDNTVVIHNGRITEWTATFDTATNGQPTPGAARDVAAPIVTGSNTSMPELFGIPVSLLAAALTAISGATLLLRSVRRG